MSTASKSRVDDESSADDAMARNAVRDAWERVHGTVSGTEQQAR
jgi:hypothetical protein